jgi:phosphatidylserine decarboxylase
MTSGISAAWREAKIIVIGLAGLSVLAWVARLRWLGLALLGGLGWVFYFFRDPERVPPSPHPDWILSPADGKVTQIDQVHEPYFFNGPAQRITIFLSLMDVHVQRVPYQGQVKFLRRESGDFAPAFLHSAEENTYHYLGLVTPRGLIGVKQMVGILARRIVCRPNLDDWLDTGQRFGLIKFGSRVDLLLPANCEIIVQVGQQLHAGQSIVGRWLDN